MSVEKGVARWRDVFGPDEVIQRVRPKETDRYLLNPHKGTTTFQRFNGDPLYPGLSWNDREGPVEFKPFDGNLKNPRYPQTTISYCRWLWSVIEPQKGKYEWEIIDGTLDAARARGQTVQMRLQPYIGDSTPGWYWKLGGTRAGEGSVEIDHNNPLYLEHWGDLLRAFGRRYDGHPGLESFDMAYGGSCGETGGNTSDETAEKLIDVYLESFQKTQLLSMLGTHGCKYAATKGRNIGWRADCYGDVRTDGHGVVPDGLCWCHMRDAYPKEVVQCGVSDAWKTAPVTLETCWTVGYWLEKGWDVDWILEQGYKYHLSVFMPKSSFIPEEWTERIDEFNKRMGYRFVLRQLTLPLEAKPGQPIQCDFWIDNVGCAPVYRPYGLAFRLRQGGKEDVVRFEADVRTWMPGHTWFSEEIAFPKSLERGEAKLDVGIVDDEGRPVARLAIEEVLEDGWHPLTSMDVV